MVKHRESGNLTAGTRWEKKRFLFIYRNQYFKVHVSFRVWGILMNHYKNAYLTNEFPRNLARAIATLTVSGMSLVVLDELSDFFDARNLGKTDLRYIMKHHENPQTKTGDLPYQRVISLRIQTPP